MAVDLAFVERVRAALAAAGEAEEVKMFGGVCFKLNGNMVAGASQRGLLLRVGKEQQSAALARPNARAMEMSLRPVPGYVVVDPPPADGPALREWLDLAVALVRTLPPKAARARKR